MEAQISARIHSLLLGYVQQHITTDYVQFTRAALVSLEQVPDHDPSSLTLPTDPFTTLSQIYHIGTLPPYSEKFATTQEALLFIKKTLALPKALLKSEFTSRGRDAWNQYGDDALYPIESILTRRAMRGTPVLGKSAGARQALGMQKVDTRSFASLTASEPILFKPIDVEPVPEPQVKFNQVLDVTYHLEGDYAAVRNLLQSAAVMCRFHSPSPGVVERDYRRAYLPSNFNFDPPIPQTPPPDSPPFTPIFSRNERHNRTEGRHSKGNIAVLRSYAELPERIGAVVGREALDMGRCNDIATAEDIPSASMVIVDGWQTYNVSSPSTISSFEDDELDELAEMFPPSPNTSIIVELENAKLGAFQIIVVLFPALELVDTDEIQIPKDRRIGGNLGGLRDLQRIVDNTRKAGGYGAFVTNLLTSPFCHPEDGCQITIKPPKSQTPVYKENDETIGPSEMDNELESMCGQASSVSANKENDSTEAEGFRQDTDIQNILHPLPLRPGHFFAQRHSGQHLLITEDLLFEKEPKEELPFKLMQVPTLPDPNDGVQRNTLRYSDYLATEVKGYQNAQAKRDVSPMRFLKNANGMAPLRVALSWVPFTRTSPLPVHGEILQNDLEGEEASRCEVDSLLAKACLDDKAGVQKDSELNDQQRWRDYGGESKEADEFSAEIARCEIIMTRKERIGLLAREKGLVNQDHEVDGSDEEFDRSEQTDPDTYLSADVVKEIEVTKNTSMGPFRQEGQLNDGHETESRPAKRPRLDVDDSGIGLMSQDASYDFNQDELVHDKLHGTSTEDNELELMNDLGYENNEDDSRPIMTGIVEVSIANTCGDYHESQSNREGSFSGTAQEPLRPVQEDDGCPIYCSQGLGLRFISTKNEHSMLYLDHSASLGDEQNGMGPQTSEKTTFKKIDLDLESYLGIEAFAKLRAKSLTTPQPVDMANEVYPLPKCDQPLASSVPRTVPKEIYDDKTVRMPSQLLQPRTTHRYMASLGLLQKQVLVRSLSTSCLVELVERELLEVDLIIDPQTAVIFTSLLSLPAFGQKLLDTLSKQSWVYKRVLVVFEAYPESKSFRHPKIQKHHGLEMELDAFTAPIIKAIKKFRRNVNIEEGCGRKSTGCEMWCAFATSVSEAAACARLFGDEAERVDSTEGALWGDREWLDVDVSQQDEWDLGSLAGMNCFTASIVLSQMTLQQFLDMTPEQRLAMFDRFIGVEAIMALNMDIERRMKIVYDDADV